MSCCQAHTVVGKETDRLTETQTRTHTDVQTHTRAHAHTHARARTHTRTRARAHTHTHTHTRAHAHTHMRTHTHTPGPGGDLPRRSTRACSSCLFFGRTSLDMMVICDSHVSIIVLAVHVVLSLLCDLLASGLIV